MTGDLADRVHITAINSPGLVTLGGDTAPLELIGTRLEHQGRFMRWLKVNYAFHTHQMDPIRDQLLESLASIKPQAGNIPFVSTVTGGVFPGEQLDAAERCGRVEGHFELVLSGGKVPGIALGLGELAPA